MIYALTILCLLQEPPEPAPRRRSVRSEVRVLIEESPEGDYEHEYYKQPWPVEHRAVAGRSSSSVWYRTVCRPQEDEDRRPIFAPMRTSPTLPLSLSVAAGVPRLSVTTTSGFSTTTVNGRPRNDPIISTKPALFGGGGGGSDTNSDAPFLYGPDLDLVLASDVSAWRPARWMPEGSSIRLFARALFGSFEVFDTPTTLQLYGIGPRLTVPVLKTGSLEAALVVSAGPAFLHTGIGDAVGFDGGVGIRLEQSFGATVSIVAAIEGNLYFSKNVSALGPVVNLGINLSW
ncbi:MAG TPA: hypothetical protein VNM14_13495 [Planctomycetota bacterium]|jgi:hypothetical protein|nr:hypothetical protein [Planctomycetota bacterium]